VSYVCRICGEEWTEIPDGAIEIAATYRGALYQFGNAVHDLRRIASPKLAEPNPPVRVLVQEVIQAPVPEQNLPEQPLVQEVVAEIEDESELTEFSAIASLAHAFSRINRNTK